ncbi:MAG: DPP IV N-terminal domain-containing protein [Candidatus Aminicenantales bacterium]|jgi:dipeptidyl-peptidase-4
MKKLSKLMIPLALILAGFAVVPSFSRTDPAARPVPGKQRIVGRALYDKLRKDGRTLVKLDGLASLNWTPDGKGYFVFEDGTFKRIDLATGEKSSLFDDAKLLAAVNAVTGRQEGKLFFSRFEFLEDGKKIQFSGFNKVFIYDPATGKLFSYEPERTVAGVRGRGYGDVLSPDLRYRAFNRSYNLYIKDMDGNETALTADGTEDLRDGFPDWVYPEELNQYQAFWWSPDSKKIAFMQFDESPVAKYPIVHDVAPMPRTEFQGYPVPGANNPIVRLFIVDVATKKIVRLETGDDLDVYLYRGQWTNDGREFTYHRLNRLQNRVEVFAADPATGKTRLVLKDEDPCYIDEQTDLDFLKDNQRFLWTSERSGWREIYLYGLDGKLLKQLTSARLPVQSILDIDEAGGWVYFTGAENNGTESHLYKVKLDGTGFTKMTKEPGMHMVSLAPGFSYYTDTFSNFDQPMKSTLCQADGKAVKVIGQAVAGKEFQALKLIKPEHFLFKSADGKYDLDGLVYFPAHFNPKEKYPVLLSVYGGPGSKGVSNTYKMTDGSQALAQLGFLVAVCDYRGVSGRGKNFQNLHYLKLGQVELEDHIAFVKALGQRPYADTGRVGITGHSYGGYFTCLCLLKAPDVFHVGVAGAPVTDWRNYDSIYTERYMRRPQDNPEGYEKGSCLTYAKNLKGKLFIHHGAVDDNVHPTNTIQLVQALLKENKTFDLMIYPEQQHGIGFQRYPESRVEYFIEHLKPVVK